MRPVIAPLATLLALLALVLLSRMRGAVPAGVAAPTPADQRSGSETSGGAVGPVEGPAEFDSGSEANSSLESSTVTQGTAGPLPSVVASPGARTSERLRVVSELDARPLSGVVVEVVGKNALDGGGGVTDKKGRATVQRNPSVGYYFRKSGYVRRLLHATELYEAAPARPVDGETVVVELRPLAKISGSVALAPNASGTDGPAPRPPDRGVKGFLAPQGFVWVRERSPDGPRLLDSGTRILQPGSLPRTLEGATADLSPDGSWSLDVSIPYSVDSLRDLVIEHAHANGESRLVGVIRRLRPGDELVLQDEWEYEESLKLAFEGDGALAFARNGLLHLWRAEAGGTREQPEATLHLDKEGAATVRHLPAGNWDYALHMDRPGFPLSWLPAGSFTRKGGEHERVLTWEGTAFEVHVQASERRTRSRVTVAVVPYGSPLKRGHHLNLGDKWLIPSPPDGGSYDIIATRRAARSVELERSRAHSSAAGVEPWIDEVIRLPLDTTQACFELLFTSRGPVPGTPGQSR